MDVDIIMQVKTKGNSQGRHFCCENGKVEINQSRAQAYAKFSSAKVSLEQANIILIFNAILCM